MNEPFTAHLVGGPFDGQTKPDVPYDSRRLILPTTIISIGEQGDLETGFVRGYKDAIYERVGDSVTFEFCGHAKEPGLQP